ncbi:F-box only protein 21-like [Perca flavescens]|uniref:F-box only protein 21-like n=1 Tax=Perca flavescens TaxID=8167 RepID=UPI00106E14FB|nr:F-box only protein 21-like [Perca flavescens]
MADDSPVSEDIYDYVYIDAFGKGKQLTAKECEYLIGHQVTADYYSAISTTEVLLRMVGNLLNIGKRGEGNEKSYQLLRDSLDLYLTINPDNVQYLLLQARLYFHLGIWPEKVLDILQHIQALDPSQHGAVGYLVQHTLEHIQHKKHPVTPEVKKRSVSEHLEVQYSVGLIMKHKREPGAPLGPPGDRPPGGGTLLLRVFSEFADTHYFANEELQTRYPEDMVETLGTVQELYHRLTPGTGNQDQALATDQNNHQAMPM